MTRAFALLFTVAAVCILFRLDGYGGYRALFALLGHGGSYWKTLEPGASDNPPWVQAALQDGPVSLTLATLEWRSPAAGLETAESKVLLDGAEVDTLLLARFEPSRVRFEIHVDQTGANSIDGWAEKLGAQFVINGSYFDRQGLPSTPLISNGRPLGPTEYDAVHGALILDGDRPDVIDLHDQKWSEILRGRTNALVSYPLLISSQRSVQVKSDRRWIASRSFVGIDSQQRLVFGTTLGGFFSLSRLAEFLPATSLNLTSALNLDGGPIACQAWQVGTVTRRACGTWETQTKGDTIKMLQPMVEGPHWGLPIVIAGFIKAA